MTKITLQDLYDISFVDTDERDWTEYRAISFDVIAQFLNEKWLLEVTDTKNEHTL